MSEASVHPSYANPTVQEALCELHFSLTEGQRWDPAWFAELYEAAEDYPHMVPDPLYEFGAEIRPDGIFHQIKKGGIRTTYRHKSRDHVLQLSETTFTINELRPYPGWDTFVSDIRAGWALLQSIIKPAGVPRIGLRYINRIPRNQRNEPISEWLAANEYIPERLRTATDRFHYRLQLPLSDSLRMVLTVAELDADGRSWIMLDIDVVLLATLDTHWATLESHLQRMHESTWAVFQSFLTPRLSAILEEIGK